MTRTAEIIAAEINNWNLKSATELRDLIAELKTACDKEGVDAQAFLSLDDLPSAPIPDDIDTSYPVWAVDLSGSALTGEAAEWVETLDEVRSA